MAITVKILDHFTFACAVEEGAKSVPVEIINFPNVNRDDLNNFDDCTSFYEQQMEFGTCDTDIQTARDQFEMDRDTCDVIETAIAFDDNGYMSIDDDLQEFVMDLIEDTREDHPWMDDDAIMSFLDKDMPKGANIAVH
jgi:hypothetical protein